MGKIIDKIVLFDIGWNDCNGFILNILNINDKCLFSLNFNISGNKFIVMDLLWITVIEKPKY
jgi:hypothetical protein